MFVHLACKFTQNMQNLRKFSYTKMLSRQPLGTNVRERESYHYHQGVYEAVPRQRVGSFVASAAYGSGQDCLWFGRVVFFCLWDFRLAFLDRGVPCLGFLEWQYQSIRSTPRVQFVKQLRIPQCLCHPVAGLVWYGWTVTHGLDAVDVTRTNCHRNTHFCQ